MKYRKMNGTDFEVSEVGFGVWTVSTNWWGVTDQDLRYKLMKSAYHDYGINFYDTSNTYGAGYGETIFAETMTDVRDKLIIATKFGYDIDAPHDGAAGHRERVQRWTKDFIKASCDASLKRLGTDYIDLYQSHNPRMDAIDNSEVLEALHELKDEGKIRAFGTAEGPKMQPERQIDEAVASAKLGYHSAQIIYNMLEQQLGPDAFAAAKEHDSNVLVRVPHSSGMLEGNITADTKYDKSDHRSHRPQEWITEGLHKIGQLDFLTADGTRTLGQVALQFCMCEETLKSAIPNIYNEEQLEEFATAVDKPAISEDEFEKIQALYANNFGLEAGASM